MRHADDELVHVVCRGAVQQLVQDRHRALGAFERKALVADEAGVQEVLELFGRDEAFENAAPRGGVERPGVGGRLHALLQPALLLRYLYVHVLAADLAAVGLAHRLENLAQRRHRLRRAAAAHRFTERAGDEFAVEVPDGEAVIGRIEFGVVAGLGAQRIEVRDQVPAHAVGIDQLQHRRLLGDLGSALAAARPERFAVGLPAHGLVRQPQVRENLVVELVLALRAAPARWRETARIRRPV